MGGSTADDGGTQAIDVYATTYGVPDATPQEAAPMTGETGVAALIPVPDAAVVPVPDATVDAPAAVPDAATDAAAPRSDAATDAPAPLPESGAAPVPDAMVDAQDAAPPIYCIPPDTAAGEGDPCPPALTCGARVENECGPTPCNIIVTGTGAPMYPCRGRLMCDPSGQCVQGPGTVGCVDMPFGREPCQAISTIITSPEQCATYATYSGPYVNSGCQWFSQCQPNPTMGVDCFLAGSTGACPKAGCDTSGGCLPQSCDIADEATCVATPYCVWYPLFTQ